MAAEIQVCHDELETSKRRWKEVHDVAEVPLDIEHDGGQVVEAREEGSDVEGGLEDSGAEAQMGEF